MAIQGVIFLSKGRQQETSKGDKIPKREMKFLYNAVTKIHDPCTHLNRKGIFILIFILVAVGG